MNRYTHYLLMLLLLSIVTSCKKDFLEVPEDTTVPVRQTYVTDLKTTGDYFNGLYVLLARDFFQGYNQIYSDLVADNIKLATASATLFSTQYNWTQPASAVSSLGGNNMNGIWLDGYKIIRSCNFVLAKAETFRGDDPVKADNIKAQAYSLRALVHFILVNIFAQPACYTPDASHPGIPYITSDDWTQPLDSRNTVSEVYASLVNDLNQAIPLFSTVPKTSADLLYLNINSTKALLARVYLFKGDYSMARGVARDVVTNVPLLTVAGGYPNGLFKNLAPGATETLFQLSPSQTNVTLTDPANPSLTYTATYNTDFQGRYFVSPKNFVATTDIATKLTQNTTDVRKSWVTLTGGVWNITKYPQSVVSAITIAPRSYYQTLFRSSEMFLILAESYTQLNNDDSARFFVNAIRTRANLTALNTAVVGQALVDSIYTERRRELAFEGLRMFDLLRWKKEVNRTDAWNAASKNLPYPSKNAIAPLPLNDVNISGLEQNPGYTD